MQQPYSIYRVAEIPEDRRKQGVQWLVLEEYQCDRHGGAQRLVRVFVIGPRVVLMQGPHARKEFIQYPDTESAFRMAAQDWGVEKTSWVLTPERVDLNGILMWYGDVILDAARAARWSWSALEPPNPEGTCIVCIHSYDNEQRQIPTTHEVEHDESDPPLPSSLEYWQICALCYDRFIAHPGLTTLIEQALRSEAQK